LAVERPVEAVFFENRLIICWIGYLPTRDIDVVSRACMTQRLFWACPFTLGAPPASSFSSRASTHPPGHFLKMVSPLCSSFHCLPPALKGCGRPFCLFPPAQHSPENFPLLDGSSFPFDADLLLHSAAHSTSRTFFRRSLFRPPPLLTFSFLQNQWDSLLTGEINAQSWDHQLPAFFKQCEDPFTGLYDAV